jgi:hypothetical protein
VTLGVRRQQRGHVHEVLGSGWRAGPRMH